MNQDWIEFNSMNLPEEGKVVLISYQTPFFKDIVGTAEWDKYLGWYLITNHGPVHIKDWDVMAWMPLPDAYKE